MTAPKVRPAVPAIALPEAEAAGALGLGPTAVRERVAPDLRVIRLGIKTLYPVVELERWATENAAPVLPERRA